MLRADKAGAEFLGAATESAGEVPDAALVVGAAVVVVSRLCLLWLEMRPR